MIASIAEPKYERGNPRVGARALADAKASLRRQIDRLERQLGALAFELGCPGRAQPLPREPQAHACPLPGSSR